MEVHCLKDWVSDGLTVVLNRERKGDKQIVHYIHAVFVNFSILDLRFLNTLTSPVVSFPISFSLFLFSISLLLFLIYLFSLCCCSPFLAQVI